MHRLRARIDRVQKMASAAIGQDLNLERPCHGGLADRLASPTGRTDAEKGDSAKPEALLRADQDRDRFRELERQSFTRRLTEAEQIELGELDRCLPPDPRNALATAI